MAKIYSQLEYAQIHNLAGDPASTALGLIYYNTGTNTVKYYNGTAWKTVVNLDGSQVLTAKDYDGGTASNTSRITVPKDTFANITALNRKEGTLWYASDIDKLYVDDGSTLIAVGSGSGAGGINYIDQFDIEGAITGYVTYADAAQSTPVDASGGAPSVTVAKSAVSPLRGLNSLLFTKDAANRQGEGFAYAISIAATDQAKLFTWEMDYTISSGTFATGDVSLFVYDVTNAAVIWCSPYQIENLSGYGKIKVTFQTAYNSQSYRLVWHVASTSASAYTMRFDNILCGPQVITYGAVIGTPVAWTPTGSWVANTTYTGEWTRVGSYAEYIVKVACTGAPTSASLTVNLPHTIDTARLLEDTGNIGHLTLGTADIVDTGSQFYTGLVAYNTTTSVIVKDTLANTTFASHGSSVTEVEPFTFANGDFVTLTFRVPVLGWGVTQSISGVDAGDGRVVAFRGTNSAATSITDSTYVVVPFTSELDTLGAWATDTYNIKVSGYYEVSAMVQMSAGSWTTDSEEAGLYLYKNGSVYTILDKMFSPSTATFRPTIRGTTIVQCVAGDTLKIYVNQNSGAALTLINNASNNHLSIRRLQGASSIAAGETVSCRYKTAAGQSINNSSNTTVVFGTKSWDTHGAFNAATGVFTAPVAGKYAVQGSLTLSSAGWTVATEQFAMITLVNGVNAEKMATHMSQATNTFETYITGGTTVDLVAGGTFAIQAYQTSGGAVNLQADANYNWIVITKVGV